MTWAGVLPYLAGVAAFGTLLLGAVRLGLIEVSAAKGANRKVDADAEATRMDTAEQLIKMVRSELAAQKSRLYETEARSERLEARVGTLEDGLLLHVQPLITWLDAGAEPPPPAVSDHLRSLLREIRQNR